MVRHVALRGARTYCLPGAKVSDIRTALPPLIRDHPQASSIIIHAGSNDIGLQQSERLKDDFRALISSVLAADRTCIISGPFPSPCYGDGKFSSIRGLHIWLKGYCCLLRIPFIDNFNTFWRRFDLFARDGLHPNWSGAQLLSTGMDLAKRSALAVDVELGANRHEA